MKSLDMFGRLFNYLLDGPQNKKEEKEQQRLLSDIQALSNAEKLEAVTTNPYYIYCIGTPSDSIIETAIRQNFRCINNFLSFSEIPKPIAMGDISKHLQLIRMGIGLDEKPHFIGNHLIIYIDETDYSGFQEWLILHETQHGTWDLFVAGRDLDDVDSKDFHPKATLELQTAIKQLNSIDPVDV